MSLLSYKFYILNDRYPSKKYQYTLFGVDDTSKIELITSTEYKINFILQNSHIPLVVTDTDGYYVNVSFEFDGEVIWKYRRKDDPAIVTVVAEEIIKAFPEVSTQNTEELRLTILNLKLGILEKINSFNSNLVVMDSNKICGSSLSDFVYTCSKDEPFFDIIYDYCKETNRPHIIITQKDGGINVNYVKENGESRNKKFYRTLPQQVSLFNYIRNIAIETLK